VFLSLKSMSKDSISIGIRGTNMNASMPPRKMNPDTVNVKFYSIPSTFEGPWMQRAIALRI
jgi:hypothetical protein